MPPEAATGPAAAPRHSVRRGLSPLRASLRVPCRSRSHQVADHRFHIAFDLADLGEFRGFGPSERGAGLLRKPPRNFRLAQARRPDHDDVLGTTSLAISGGSFCLRYAVSERDGDCLLGGASWPTTCSFISATISRGVRSSRAIFVFFCCSSVQRSPDAFSFWAAQYSQRLSALARISVILQW